MSYSLVTLLFVLLFMSAVPNVSSTAYASTDAEYTKVQQWVAKNAKFNQGCTNIMDSTLNGLADRLKENDPTAFPDAEALQKIKDTIPTLFKTVTDPTPDEKTKILTIIAKQMFPGQQCRTRQPTDDESTVLGLRATIIDQAMTVVSPDTWSAISIKSACIIVDVLRVIHESFTGGKVAYLGSDPISEIHSAVSTAVVSGHTIGSFEYIPSVDLVISTYNIISPNGYIAYLKKEPVYYKYAKLVQTLCEIRVSLYHKFNPGLQPGDVKKIVEYIWYKYPFHSRCEMPDTSDFDSISQDICGIESGKTLSANVKWRVQVELGELFKNVQALDGDDKLRSRVAACIAAIADDTCAYKAEVRVGGDRAALRRAAFTHLKMSCPQGDCGNKAIQYNCEIYGYLVILNTATSTPFTIRSTLRTEIRTVLNRMTSPVFAVDGVVSFDDLVRAVKAVVADTTIRTWIQADAGKYACLVRQIQAELITPVATVENPPASGGDGGSTEESQAPPAPPARPATPVTPATPATLVTPTTTPIDGSASSGLSGGVIAGIVLLVIIFVVLLAFAVYWFIIRDNS